MGISQRSTQVDTRASSNDVRVGGIMMVGWGYNDGRVGGIMMVGWGYNDGRVGGIMMVGWGV